MHKHYGTLVFVIALAVLQVSCGNSAVDSPPTAALEEMPLQIATDVRDNLIGHYKNIAGKPPVNRDPNTYTFDFLEQSRSITAEGEGMIRGMFLFSVDNRPPRQGTLDLFYVPENGTWRRTFRYHIEEQHLDTTILHTQIKHSMTGVPLKQAEVFARRLKDEFCTSRRIRTDAQGVAQLEVLTGEFQILVDHPDYQPVNIPTVSATESELHVGEIEMTPVLKEPQLPAKFKNL